LFKVCGPSFVAVGMWNGLKVLPSKHLTPQYCTKLIALHIVSVWFLCSTFNSQKIPHYIRLCLSVWQASLTDACKGTLTFSLTL
jgi:hypothetical protein